MTRVNRAGSLMATLMVAALGAVAAPAASAAEETIYDGIRYAVATEAGETCLSAERGDGTIASTCHPAGEIADTPAVLILPEFGTSAGAVAAAVSDTVKKATVAGETSTVKDGLVVFPQVSLDEGAITFTRADASTLISEWGSLGGTNRSDPITDLETTEAAAWDAIDAPIALAGASYVPYWDGYTAPQTDHSNNSYSRKNRNMASVNYNGYAGVIVRNKSYSFTASAHGNGNVDLQFSRRAVYASCHVDGGGGRDLYYLKCKYRV